MNKIEWKIGNIYLINDMTSQYQATLEGFIINQIPANWKDKISYRNRADNSVYFVLSFISTFSKKLRYVLSRPSLSGYITSVMFDSVPYSEIVLDGIEYGDTIEELLIKLKENRIFTKELSYDATYKEGYISSKL